MWSYILTWACMQYFVSCQWHTHVTMWEKTVCFHQPRVWSVVNHLLQIHECITKVMSMALLVPTLGLVHNIIVLPICWALKYFSYAENACFSASLFSMPSPRWRPCATHQLDDVLVGIEHLSCTAAWGDSRYATSRVSLPHRYPSPYFPQWWVISRSRYITWRLWLSDPIATDLVWLSLPASPLCMYICIGL